MIIFAQTKKPERKAELFPVKAFFVSLSSDRLAKENAIPKIKVSLSVVYYFDKLNIIPDNPYEHKNS
jgi:hypothetical protein